MKGSNLCHVSIDTSLILPNLRSIVYTWCTFMAHLILVWCTSIAFMMVLYQILSPSSSILIRDFPGFIVHFLPVKTIEISSEQSEL